MKKLGLTLAFIVLGLILFSGENISHFRSSFTGIKDKATAETFLNTKITESNINNAITIMSYKGVCNMMMAQYVSNPFTKYSWFNKGKDMLEGSIKMNKNVENLHLRLLVQVNAPVFLGYRSEIEADKKYILENLEKSSIPDETKRSIIKSLIVSGKLYEFKELAIKYRVKL